jgi:hypothetical protein
MTGAPKPKWGAAACPRQQRRNRAPWPALQHTTGMDLEEEVCLCSRSRREFSLFHIHFITSPEIV